MIKPQDLRIFTKWTSLPIFLTSQKIKRRLLGLLFQVADIMEDLYWEQVFPDRDAALGSMVNEDVIRFFKINYGPWERLNGNLPFLPDYGAKACRIGLLPGRHDQGRI